MNSKIVIGIVVVIVIVGIIMNYHIFDDTKDSTNSFNITPFLIKVGGEGEPIFVKSASTIFDVFVYSLEKNMEKSTPDFPIYSEAYLFYNPENSNLYEQLSVNDELQKTVVVAPIFTKTAYGDEGFYDYYTNQCDESCIDSIPIRYELPMVYTSSVNAIKALTMLGYFIITDIEIEKDPNILKKYDKVIILHNEYVTQNEFDAITNHPKVLYLYPNALYAKIKYDPQKNSITLIRGHGYPNSDISNGFDWKFDNSPLEYDFNCKDWKFYEIENGAMLNCYPESLIVDNKELLMAIKEY